MFQRQKDKIVYLRQQTDVNCKWKTRGNRLATYGESSDDICEIRWRHMGNRLATFKQIWIDDCGSVVTQKHVATQRMTLLYSSVH